MIVKRHAAAAFNAEVMIDSRSTGLHWALHAPWSALRGPNCDTGSPVEGVEGTARTSAERLISVGWRTHRKRGVNGHSPHL